ncbi:MAG: SDR family oxidoreductase [SAR202 cluster bacterium]|nr:SDR family oxidoreductase [SAR202 cluster bacterium]
MRLKDRVALITGGGSGIGRATALLFAREGAKVVVADLAAKNAKAVAKEVRAAGGAATPVAGDVTSPKDAEAMVKAAVSAYGRLQVLVNSAGISARQAPPGAPHEVVWDKVIGVNLKGTYLVSWYAVTEIAKAGGGAIVNLGSIMSLVAYPLGVQVWGGAMTGFNPYNPSKGAVLQLTRNMAVHFAKQNIRVNCICPGFVVSPLTEKLLNDPEANKALTEKHPIGRLGTPEDIANAALFLASDESAFMTGAPLIVDGGYTAV